MSTDTAKQILKYFNGRSDVIAAQPKGSTFRPVHKPMTEEMLLAEHVEGTTCFGFYLMRPDSTVLCSCIDFDNHPDQPDPAWRDKAEKLYYFLEEQEFDPCLEISASGYGAHVWLFFSEPVPAFLIRRFWVAIDGVLKIDFREVYPRQDTLKGKGLGNLVRYPYWNRSRFVDPDSDWCDIEFANCTTVSKDEIELFCQKLGTSTAPPEPAGGLSGRMKQLLAVENSDLSLRWRGIPRETSKDNSRSSIVFQIACEAVYQRIPTEEIFDALRHWCDEEGYKKSDEWIKLTIDNAYKSVAKRTSEVKGETLAIGCVRQFFKRRSGQQYIRTGIEPLDRAIDGLGRGEMGIFGARPGGGKSAFALQYGLHNAEQGIPVLMLNAEMSEFEIGRRLVMRYVGGEETTWDEDAVLPLIESKLRNTKFFYQGVASIADVEQSIRLYSNSHKIQLVIIDYLQLLRSDKVTGRYEVVTEISQRIKHIARKYDVAVLALCQVSREVERMEEIDFKSDMLRESGQLENDADMIMFGHWYGRGKAAGTEPKYLVQITKRRNGPIRRDKVFLKFDAETQTFGY